MALLRFRLPASGAAPVSPAIQSYTHDQGTRRPLPTSGSTALATQAYTPDGADHLSAGDAHHVQFVSDALTTGTVFTAGNALKLCVQMLEAHANNNLNLQLWVGVYSNDGSTLQATLRSKVEQANELNTSLESRFLSTTLSGSYTTVSGDRLVVEISVEGTPSASGGTQGHNSSIRFGENGAGGDLAENNTQTGTTLNPWIEITSTSPSIAADAGSYSVTGTAATLKRALVIAATTTAFAVTGTAATLKQTYLFSADPGAYTITDPVDTRLKRTVPGDHGVYTVTGTAASLLRASRLDAAAGAYSVTGTDVTLTQGFPIVADPGSYAVTGTDATLRRDAVMPASSGSYAVSGTDAALVRGLAVLASPGSYAWTGTDATLTATGGSTTLTADPGAYSIAGTAASLLQASIITAAAGAYTITDPVDTRLRRTVPGEHGVYTVTGSAISAHLVKLGGVGEYLINGTAASLVPARMLVASSGSYSVTGTDAALSTSSSTSMVAEPGSYAVSGSAAALQQTSILGADAGAYSVTGTTAGLLAGRVLTATSGAYVFSGTSATLTEATLTSPTQIIAALARSRVLPSPYRNRFLGAD